MEGNAEKRLQAIGSVLAPDSRMLLEQCEAHQAQASNNYYPYMWRFYQGHRSSLLRIWRALKFHSTTQDASLGRASILFWRTKQVMRNGSPCPSPGNDLDWMPDTWFRLVTGAAKREPVGRVHRRFFELCVFTQMMWDLKSGDAAIEGSREYADYREQLISKEEATEMTAAYQQEAGIPTDAKEFGAQRRQWLTWIAQETDRSFSENDALRIEMRRLRQSSTGTTTLRFPGCGARASTLPPMAHAGTCTSRTFSPSITSVTEAMAVSGYYHVSDTYIALFSHFIPCGVWEAVYILDGLLKNGSDIQPDVLHADTQGQSEPVFALAHLLGIELMPRIRNWKNIDLCRPDRKAHYEHMNHSSAKPSTGH